MKNNKLIKIVFIFIFVFFILFIGYVIKKIVIFNNLENKIYQLNQKNNIYVKIDTSSTTIERYKKDNVEKNIIHHKKENLIYTQIIKDNIRLFFTDDNTKKTVSTYDATNFSSSDMIGNYIETDNFFEKIVFNIFSNISIENIDNKFCYAIQEKHNSSRFITEKCKSDILYIERDTGLPVKEIIEYDDKQEIITYKYSFDTVNNEDLVIPDISQYEKI